MTTPNGHRDPRHTERTDRPEQPLPRPVAMRLALARLAVSWERIWPALWPALALVVLFFAFAFLDIWRHVPRPMQALAIFAFVIGAGYLSWRNLTRTRLAKRRESLRRLESDSGLTHRPLSTFDDAPAMGSSDPAARALWKAHRARLADKMKNVGVVWPRTDPPKHDPYALRLLLILLLGVSLLIAGSEWGDRLRQAVSPFLGPPLPADAAIDAWIEPPAYTGLPVITLPDTRGTDDAAERPAVKAPAGSALVVRFAGITGRPAIELTPADRRVAQGQRPQARVSRADGVLQGRAVIDQTMDVRVAYRGVTLGQWQVAVTADLPPSISMTAPPEPTGTASLRFSYQLNDDYGVTQAAARITLVPTSEAEADQIAAFQDTVSEEAETAGDPATDDPAAQDDGAEAEDAAPWPNPAEPEVVALPVPAARPGTTEETAIENLAAHPWAGRQVLVQLEARDGADQTAFSQGVQIRLPERLFLEPLARALAEQRRLLAADPQNVFRVAMALDALTVAPEQFIDDPIVYLGLRSAYWRLSHDPRADYVREVYDMLWDLALRIEDGDLSQSLDRLRQVQKALLDALARNAPADEIRQLMAQLREAMNQYLAELMQQADQGAVPDGAAETVEAQDLDSLLQSIQEMAELGAHDQARQMLSELQNLLEGLKPSASGGGGGQGSGGQGTPSPQEQALSGALEELSEIISRQRNLLDETYRNVAPAYGDGSRSGELQEAFRRALGAARPMGSIPPPSRNPLKRGSRGDPFVNEAPPQSGSPSLAEAEEMLRKLLRDNLDAHINERPQSGGQAAQPSQGRPSANGSPSGPPSPGGSGDGRSGGSLAGDQETLRQALDAVRQGLGGTGLASPQDLDQAGQAMGGASSALRQEDFDGAVSSQDEALNALRSAAESLAQELLQRQGQRQGGGVAQQEAPGQYGPGGFQDSGAVKLPDQSELQRAREILEELRKRSGDRSRSRSELEYYERLLKTF